MSVEPPPDWVTSDAAFNRRVSLLDGQAARATQSIPRVVLEEAPDDERSLQSDHMTNRWAEPVEMARADGPTKARSDGLAWLVRRRWEEVGFSTLRRTQLVALVCLVVVSALALYGWHRGALWSTATETFAEGADGTPAAPRLRSDQVAWNDVGAESGDDGQRATASFASDRPLGDQADADEPRSGAKLFVADGKRSAKGTASSVSDDGSADGADRRSSTGAPNASDGSTAPATRSTNRKETEKAGPTVVRYENCGEAAAAGAAPIRLGEPGYRLSLDRDKDGVACENGSAPEDPGDAPVDSSFSNPPTTRSNSITTTASTTAAGTTSIGTSTTVTVGSTTEPRPNSTTSTTVISTTTESRRTTSTSTTVATTASTTSPSTTTATSATSTAPTSATTRPSSTTSGPTTTTTVPTTTTSEATTVSSPTSAVERPSIDPVAASPESTNGGPT